VQKSDGILKLLPCLSCARDVFQQPVNPDLLVIV
jgi:hypothetical protein